MKDLLEKGMAIHSSILAWRIPWIEGLAGYSPWGWKESDWEANILLRLSRKLGWLPQFLEKQQYGKGMKMESETWNFIIFVTNSLCDLMQK